MLPLPSEVAESWEECSPALFTLAPVVKPPASLLAYTSRRMRRLLTGCMIARAGISAAAGLCSLRGRPRILETKRPERCSVPASLQVVCYWGVVPLQQNNLDEFARILHPPRVFASRK